MVQVDAWIALLKAQVGKPYVWGAKGPDGFDCSGLVSWSLRELGAKNVPDGSWHLAEDMVEIPLEEALKTAGALLYYPADSTRVAHIAVSLGDGRTVEARNPSVGVVIDKTAGRGWTKAGLWPGVGYEGVEVEEVTVGMCNPAVGRTTSKYGWRPRLSVNIPSMLHAGHDIANRVGTPVLAAYGGTVVAVGSGIVAGRTGMGILIRNDDGERQYYGHLSKTLVKKGQKVRTGERIGLMGKTGNVTGPHLHFEVWGKDGKPRDPMIDFRAWGVTPGKANMPEYKPVKAKTAYYTRQIDGKRGAYQIRAEQQFLADNGFYDRQVDGKDGYYTVLGWQKFLAREGFYQRAQDGKNGSYTVRAKQEFLAREGFYDRQVDGVEGAYTHRAMQGFLAQKVK